MYSWADVAERTERAYERALKAPPPSLVRRFQVSSAESVGDMASKQSVSSCVGAPHTAVYASAFLGRLIALVFLALLVCDRPVILTLVWPWISYTNEERGESPRHPVPLPAPVVDAFVGVRTGLRCAGKRWSRNST